MLESQFWFPIWVIFLLERDISLSQIVIADMIFRAAIVILEFPLGMMGDKIGRRKTYFWGAACAAITYFILIHTHNFAMLILCWILWGFFWSLISGTNTAYRYELLITGPSCSKDVQIFGYFNSIAAAALVLSHTTAGYLYSFMPSLPIWINVVFSIVAALLILTLPEVNRKVNEKAHLSWTEMQQVFQTLFRQNSLILPIIFIFALWNAYHWTPTLIFQPLLEDLGLPKSSFGLVFAAFTGMGIISGLITGRLAEIFGNFTMIIVGVLLQVTAVSLTAFGHNIFIIISGIVILRFAYNLCEPILSVLLNREIGDNIRASIISLVNLIASLIMIISRPLIGLVADNYSIQTGFMLWFFIGLVFFCISLIFLVRIKPKIDKIR